MFILGFYGSGVSKVYLDPLAHDQLAIEELLDSNAGLFVKEGDDYAAKALEWCPRVNRRGGIDELFDSLYVVSPEDKRIVEVGNQEGV